MKTRLISILFTIMAAASSLALPTITKQPADLSVSIGANVNNTVTATSTAPPIGYQWRFNDFALDLETNRSLIITNIQLPRDGSYSVVVTDSSGSVTSRVAILDVDPTFTKLTTGAILTGTGDVSGCAWADYDLDGYDDLFVCGNGRSSL